MEALMKLKLYFGSFRSKDTAKQCIQKLGEAGFLDVAFYQSGEIPGPAKPRWHASWGKCWRN
jgi:hypothetical protein